MDYNRYLLTGDQRDLRASRLVKRKEEISVHYRTQCNVICYSSVVRNLMEGSEIQKL